MKRYLWVAAALVLVLGLSGYGLLSADGSDEVVKYTLYIGLNDKDTYQQEIPTEVAEEIVTEIALKYVDGFTRTTAKGAWTDERGVITYENSLVCEFLYATEDQITKIMDEVLVALNQNSILVEREEVDCQFYSGAGLAVAAAGR